MPYPYIVALTGGIGSGKSIVANKFSTLGIPIIDADTISHQILQPKNKVFNLITQYFGSSILNTNGTLNRSALREQIFSKPEDKKWLNNLLHPLIQISTEQQIYTIHNYTTYVIWVIPLLIENELQQYADRILVIDVAPEIQITRTVIRDQTSSKQVKSILASQTSRSNRIYYADDIIDNNQSLNNLDMHINRLHHIYLHCMKLKQYRKYSF